MATEEYSEIVVMVDASSSQGANLEKLKSMLVNLADEVLHNDGSVRLTLMGFGMGPALVGSFYNAETLRAYLKDVTQADLRQGVSATNCEAALEFVNNYINNSEKLHKTFVIFTSDGMTNMDETLFDMSAWEDHSEWYMSGATASMIASYAAGGQADLLLTNGTVLEPTAVLYPELAVELKMTQKEYGLGSEEYSAVVDRLYNAITATEESGIAYTNALWKDVFAYSGLTYGPEGLYSTSRLEKAFLDYHNGIATNSYLCTIHGMKNAGFYPDWYNLGTWGGRAAAAADKLANNAKVLELYMMDFASKNNTWMNPDSTTAYHCTSEKISYNTATNFSAAVDKIETLSDEMFVTVYKDTTVTDPMSKWVTLNPSSIRIYRDDTLIYKYGEGWLTDDQPAANPITLTKTADGYDQITWRIKDGNLLYTDRYFLKYTVDVNETAEGFEYGTDYPANDPTNVTYTDASGEPQTVPVDVPNVKENEPVEDFKEGDMGFKIYKGTLDSKPISEIEFKIYHVVPAEGEVLNPTPTVEEYSKYMTEENYVGSIVTDGAGYGALKVTEKGFYLVVEQPSDKVVAPVAPYYVSVPMLNPETNEATEIVEMYPKNEVIDTEKPIEPEIPVEPDEPVYGRFTILKHDIASEERVLKNAQFQVFRLANDNDGTTETAIYNGEEILLAPVLVNDEVAVLTTDENGLATSDYLSFGMYFLVETKAPNGYNLLEEAIPVFVNATSHEYFYAVKIANTAGVALPSTGGPGVLVFTVPGIILCGAAAVMLLKKKREE